MRNSPPASLRFVMSRQWLINLTVVCVSLSGFFRTSAASVNTTIEIRLVDGRYPNEGRLEVRLPGFHETFGSYCSNVNPFLTGRLACRHLGFPALLSATANAQFGTATGPVWFKEIFCNGAATLDECLILEWFPGYTVCDHRFDVGITCFTGNVRLFGSSNEHEGIAELHVGGDEWVAMASSVDDDYLLSDWICSHLGYQFSIGATEIPANNSSSRTLCSYSSCPKYGESGLNFVECLDENTLSLCPHDWDGAVLNVLCAPESNIVPPATALEFRLATITNESHIGIMEGRLNGSSWKTVCVKVLHYWQVRSKVDSACRQLGYPWAAAFELIRYSKSPGYIGTGDDLIMRELFLGDPESLRWTTGDNACQNFDYELVSVECEKGTWLFGLTIFPCPTQSCRDRCGTPATESMCGCDAACSDCSDCCYDFDQRCSPPDVNEHDRGIFNNSPIGSSSCQLIDGYQRALVIDGCPQDWNDTTVAMQCANVSLDGPLQYEDGPFFQNEFCAECNGVTAHVNNSYYVEASAYGMDTDCSLNVTAEIQNGCRAYKSFILYNSTTYKNHHCAYCNGVNTSGVDYCIHTRSGVSPGHLEILLGRQVGVWNPEISVSLLSLDEIHCHTKETQLSIHSEGMNSTKDTNWMYFGEFANDVISCYLQTLGWQNVQLTWPFFASFYSNNMTANLTRDGTYILTTQYLTNITEFEEMMDRTLTVTPSNRSSFEESARHWVTQCGVESVDFVEVCRTSMGQIQLVCGENVYNTDNTTITALNISGNQILYIGGGQLVEASSVSLVRTYTYQLVPTTDKVSGIVVCGHEADVAVCRTPLVEETKLGSSTDGAPPIIYEGKEFQQDEVTYLPDGRILICSELFASSGEPFISFSDPLTVLNTVGYSLSIAALFATFVNYVVFAVLRNVPGGAIMSLTAALFSAQLMTLTVVDKAEHRAFCVAMAVLLHFLWLSTFAWMNVLAFDLVRTFTSQQVLNPNNKKIFLTYCLYGWGVPLLTVSACLVVHANGGEFQYGGVSSCWLVGKYAILVAFGVPLVVSLIGNVVLFGLTVHSVHASLKAAAMVRKGKSKAKETTTELWIYFKISCIMGFTWIFGCLGTFVNHQAVWYLFVITNSLQGVFIFISFGCNARIRGLWRGRLGMKPPKKDSKGTNGASISSGSTRNTSV